MHQGRMEITVNNKLETVEANLRLSEFLSQQTLLKLRGTAVAVNECVIARSQWQNHILHENDQVLIIRATQGG